MNPWGRRASETALILLVAYGVFVLIHDVATPPWSGLSDQELAQIEDSNFWSNLIAIALFSAPSVFWHITDFWPHSRPRPMIASVVLSYRTFVGVLILGLVGTAVVFSGWTENFYCRDAGPSADGKYFTLCHPPLAYGIELLTFLPILTLVGLAVVKAIVAAFDKFMSKK